VIERVEWRKRPGVLVWKKSKDWRRETRRRFDSLPASLRPYIAFSIRKSMYGFVLFEEGLEGEARQDGWRKDVSVDFDKLWGGERRFKVEVG
jgi:hypothetical protein